MQFYNICTKKEYQSQGQNKVAWLTVGTLKVMDDGKKFITLNMFPDQSFYVFEQKKNDTAKTAERVMNSGNNTPDIQIDDSDIPF